MSGKLRYVGREPSANDARFHGRSDAFFPKPPSDGTILTAYLGLPGESIEVHYAKDLALPERALLHRLGLLRPLT